MILETTYISLPELFSFTKIYAIYDKEKDLITGFFSSEENSFVIDLKTNSFRYGKSEEDFSSEDYINFNDNIYFSSNLIYRIFHISSDIQLSQLTIYINSGKRLPIEEISYRQQSRKFSAENRDSTEYPLIYKRDKKLFGGYYMNYNLGAGIDKYSNSLSLNTQMFFEVLGGDLNASISSNSVDQIFTPLEIDYKWRLYFKDINYINQILFGRINSSGTNPRQITGIQINNKKLKRNEFFNEYNLKYQINPGWETELYLNNELVAYKLPDNKDEINFIVPITYGINNFEIRQISPLNQIVSRNEIVYIPQSFQKSSTFLYNVDFGVMKESGNTLLSANGSYGLTDFISLDANYENIFTKNNNYNYFATGINGRLSGNTQLGVNYNHNNSYEINTTYLMSDKSYIKASISHYIKKADSAEKTINNWHNRDFDYTKFNINGLLRYSLFKFPLTLNYSADIVDLNNNLITNGTISIDFIHSYFKIKSYYKHFEILSESRISQNNIGLNFQYLLPDIGLGNLTTRNPRLTLLANYIPELNKITSANINFSSELVFNQIKLNFVFNYNLIVKKSDIVFRFNYDLPFIQNQSIVNSDNGNIHFNQNIRGSIGYIDDNDKVIFDKNQFNNLASIMIIPFEDKNSNGKYDKNEKIIHNSNIRLNIPANIIRDKDGTFLIKDLQPYSEYQVTIDESSIDNPFWAAAYYNFSVETDPNQVKVISVPFKEAQPVEGRIFYNNNGKLIPVQGIKLEFISKDKEIKKETFSFYDGSFYIQGLINGEYQLKVNSEYLNKLNLMQNEIFVTIDNSQTNNIEVVLQKGL